MAENNDLNREIDKRVKIIDNKLKDAFSLIKKDIQDIKNTQKNIAQNLSELDKEFKMIKSSRKLNHNRNSRVAFFQILIGLLIVGIMGYLLSSKFFSNLFTGVIGSVGETKIISLTGALLFILAILGLLFYVKIRKSRK